MKWFLETHTSRFNRRHKLFGHLLSGRCKSLIVDGSGTGYLKTVCDYVHLNPVRASLIARDQHWRRTGGAVIRRKGDAFKVKLAERLRAATTVTLRWIAQRLQMGTRGHLTHLLYWRRRRK